MPNYSRYTSSITNNTQVFGIMGGLAKNRGRTRRLTMRLVIPSSPSAGLHYMKRNNLLSVNPQCSGGVGKLNASSCRSGSLPQVTPVASVAPVAPVAPVTPVTPVTPVADLELPDCLKTNHRICYGINSEPGCFIKNNNYCCTAWDDVHGCTDASHVCVSGNYVPPLCDTPSSAFQQCNTPSPSSMPWPDEFKQDCPQPEKKYCNDAKTKVVARWTSTSPSCACIDESQVKADNLPPCKAICSTADGNVGVLEADCKTCKACTYPNCSTVPVCNTNPPVHAIVTKDLSLCPADGCDGLTISQKTMDNLAWIIHNNKEENKDDPATAILNSIGQRYIKNTISGSCNYPGHNGGSWVECTSDQCKMTASRAFPIGMSSEDISSTTGCGWWGRGAIQTTGPCNFGILSKKLTSGKYKGMFDLCKTPELICNTKKYPELKWLAGFLYWVNNIQNYAPNADNGDISWNFSDALYQAAAAQGNDSSGCVVYLNYKGGGTFVDDCCTINTKGDGVTSSCHGRPFNKANLVYSPDISNNKFICQDSGVSRDSYTCSSGNKLNSFINATSGLVNRGCPALNCIAGEVHGAFTRLKNTQMVLALLNSTREKYPDKNTLIDLVKSIREDDFNSVILATFGGDGKATPPPQIYEYDSFIIALQIAIDNFEFYAGGSDKLNTQALINLAAFLGQCLKETLQYGACDENNWTESQALANANTLCGRATSSKECDSSGIYGICEWVNSSCKQNIYGQGFTTSWKYPAVSSCGQLGQYYSQYTCSNQSEQENQCQLEYLKRRTIIANTSAHWWGAPPPLFTDGEGTLTTPLHWNS